MGSVGTSLSSGRGRENRQRPPGPHFPHNRGFTPGGGISVRSGAPFHHLVDSCRRQGRYGRDCGCGRMTRLVRHRQTKGPGTDRPGLNDSHHDTSGSSGLPGGESPRGPQHAAKAGPPEDMYGVAPRDPHGRVKAGLPEPQSPAVLSRPSPPCLLRGPSGYEASPNGLESFPPAERPPVRWLKGTNRAPDPCSNVDQVENAGSPSGREPHGDRALVVVGGRESRPQGEGGQVTRSSKGGGRRNAESRPPETRTAGEPYAWKLARHGSESGVWKRGMVRLLRHRQTKGPATDRPNLNYRATLRLYRKAASVPEPDCQGAARAQSAFDHHRGRESYSRARA